MYRAILFGAILGLALSYTIGKESLEWALLIALGIPLAVIMAIDLARNRQRKATCAALMPGQEPAPDATLLAKELIYAAIRVSIACDEAHGQTVKCKGGLPQRNESLAALPEDLVDWYAREERARNGGTSQPALHEQDPETLRRWATNARGRLIAVVEDMAGAHARRNIRFLTTIRALAEASKRIHNVETRNTHNAQPLKEMRCAIVKTLLDLAGEIDPQELDAVLRAHGSPESMRDVVLSQIEPLCESGRPWIAVVLKYTIGRSNDAPAGA